MRNYNIESLKGVVHKERPQSEGGSLSSADIFDIFQTRGFFRCGRPHLWCKKRRIFWKLCCVRTDKGEGVNFSRFCADVIYGRPLS